MGAHHHGTDPGAATERPAFDEVAHGYDPRQVDDYLATLWRYASQVTSRAAAAESALRHERERNAGVAGTEAFAAQAGGRIGQMLAIAQREADEIIDGARQIAESALEEVIEDAGANHPIVREAREQAEKLLLDAVEESRRLAVERHRELADEIARNSASLDALRHQQGEIIGAVLRLRRILGSDDVDRALTDLARAGTAPPEAGGGDPAAGGFPAAGTQDGFVPGAQDGFVPGPAAAQATGGGFPGGPEAAAPTTPRAPSAPSTPTDPAARSVLDGPTMPSTAPVGVPPRPPGVPGSPDGPGPAAGPGSPAGPGFSAAAGAPAATGQHGAVPRYGTAPQHAPAPQNDTSQRHGAAPQHGTGQHGASEHGGGLHGAGPGEAGPHGAGQRGPGWPAAAGAGGAAWDAAGAVGPLGGADGNGSSGDAPGPAVGVGAAGGRVTGRMGAAGLGRRPPGRHRQGEVADAEPYPASAAQREPAATTAGVPFRRGADEDIIDAEIVEE
ncbi:MULTISPECIES: hypothetical protein [Frankia]|uniref:Uncharacterized protein n=1 Tax=Frankia alni (strain DSM 45986 / CECT 9034 / ACN14a) TaxID=326424 RepID=Q0RLV1_FRAAA|nr:MULTISPECIES: hypothetical protein [Frankia]CAJ61503.1 hypothetical protein; putative coiled-coil domain [Frankia alni ACN14a]